MPPWLCQHVLPPFAVLLMRQTGAMQVVALGLQAPGTRLGVGRRSQRTTTARRSLSVRSEGCPFCADVGKCISICRNPQNTGLPEAVPSPEQSAPTAVCVQLDSLANNNTPRLNHGLQVIYYYCGDAAPMERSRYFGPSKDIWVRGRCPPHDAVALADPLACFSPSCRSNLTTLWQPGSNTIATCLS